MKLKSLILTFLLAFSLVAQAQIRRENIQNYATVSGVQTETLMPRANDKIYVSGLKKIFSWDATSTASHDGIEVIKQNSITTGRFVLVSPESDPTVKSIIGIIKSDGTTISAATPYEDFLPPNSIITPGIDTKIKYDENGLVIGGTSLVKTDIPIIDQNQVSNLPADLASKQPNLISGTNIKTVNGISVLGNGNIAILSTESDPIVKAINGLVKSDGTTISAATATDIPVLPQSKITNLTTDLGSKVNANANITGATNTKITYDAKGLVTSGTSLVATDIPAITQSQVTNLVTDLGSKQPNLVSGTNIKTVNGNSLLGSGDVVITPPIFSTDAAIIKAKANIRIGDFNGTTIVSKLSPLIAFSIESTTRQPSGAL